MVELLLFLINFEMLRVRHRFKNHKKMTETNEV